MARANSKSAKPTITKAEPQTITKTVWQYTNPLPIDTLEFLRGIAADYAKVKAYVYGRYSSVKHVNRLAPIYDILSEMRYCGMRQELNLPVVYYELAVHEAVTDIRMMWTALKNKIRDLVRKNENLTDEDRQYIRTVLKINTVFDAILNGKDYDMPHTVEGLSLNVNRLNNLIRRLVRRHLAKPKTGSVSSFRVSPHGYNYKDGLLQIVSRAPRKRVGLPVKDWFFTDRQIQIHIKDDYAAVAIPLDIPVRQNADYSGTIYIHVGYKDMCTLSNGHVYGQDLNALVSPETERLAAKNRERGKALSVYAASLDKGNTVKANIVKKNNLGKIKYNEQKRRKREETQNFINAELNRMLATEKPKKVVITKIVTKNRTKYYAKGINRRLARSFGGYIRQRLIYKCRLNNIEIAKISSKNTGNVCSYCGAQGKRIAYDFVCEECGYRATIGYNSARNIEIKAVPDNGSAIQERCREHSFD